MACRAAKERRVSVVLSVRQVRPRTTRWDLQGHPDIAATKEDLECEAEMENLESLELKVSNNTYVCWIVLLCSLVLTIAFCYSLHLFSFFSHHYL